MSLAASAEIPFNNSPFTKAGLVTTLQLVPSQCSTRGLKMNVDPAGAGSLPTAHTSVDEMAATPVRKLPFGTFGPAVTLQLVPFQCSMRVFTELPAAWVPTAQTSFPATPATLENIPPATPGVGITLQPVPSKRSARVTSVLALLPAM